MKFGVRVLTAAAAVGMGLTVASVAQAAPPAEKCSKSPAELQKSARKQQAYTSLKKSGVEAVQIGALAKVACAMDEVIAIRPVNLAAGARILAGAPTKDMTLKPKSSEHRLIKGLLPTDQRLGKAEEQWEKYDDYVDKALKGKDITGKFNVTQVEVEAKLKNGKKGVVCSRNGKLVVVDPGEAQRKELASALATARQSPSEAALRKFTIGGNCTVVTVLALQGDGAPQPITADYDIFFLLSRAGVSRGVRHASPGGAIERRYGFTDDRDLDLIRCMNGALRDDLQAVADRSGHEVDYLFDLVHHGPDTANPAKDDIDDKSGSYFPALVLPACRAPVLVTDKPALQQLVLDLQRERFVVPEAFTLAKEDGGYGLELKSTLDPAILVGETIRAKPGPDAPCQDGEVTAVSHARSQVTVRWAKGKPDKISFDAANDGCPADDGSDGDPLNGDPPTGDPPNGDTAPGADPKTTAFKFMTDQKLWLMYDFPVAEGPKKCEWAVVTSRSAAVADGKPWYTIHWQDHSWDDWSEPETKLMQWQQHCLSTGQPPK